jgi:hypothetical protein
MGIVDGPIADKLPAGDVRTDKMTWQNQGASARLGEV